MRKKRIKKIVAVVVAVCSVFMLVPEAKATEEYSIIAPDNLNEDDYIEENQRLYEIGVSLSRERISAQKVLSIPRLAQAGQSWSSTIMQTEGATIGDKGCYLTSFTMINRYYGGTEDPSGVNSIMGNYACPFYREIAATKFGYSISSYKTSGLTETYIINYVKGAVTENVPVIIGFDKPGGGNHMVVAKGYVNDTIVLSDPGGQNYTSLTQYLDQGYTACFLLCYVK